MSATFLQGTRRKFYRTLDIPYGYIFMEGWGPLLVLYKEQGRAALKDAVEAERLTADEAGRLETTMAECLLKNMWEVVLRAREFGVPADFVPAHKFALCGKECRFPLPHHGRVQEICSGYNMSDKIDNLQEGMAFCDRLAQRDDKIRVLDGIHIFQQMIATDLPLDQEDEEEQRAVLPEEKRLDKTAGARVSTIDISRLGIGTPLQLSIPPELLARMLFDRCR